DYLASLGEGADRRARLDDAYARIHRHEDALGERFLRAVAELPRVRVYGIADPGRIAERTPTFAFTVDGRAPAAVASALADEGIAVWDGNYYALELMQALGLEGRGGAVRAGFLHYTRASEVDALIDALRRL